MKIIWTWIAAACLVAVVTAAEPVAQPSPDKKPGLTTADWKTFDDPTAVLLTDTFAKSVNALPVAEKATAIKRLLGSLKSKEVEIRRRAALTLSALGDRSGVPTMIDDLSTATGKDRDNVVVALRIHKDERAVPALRTALTDKSPHVRGVAVPLWAN